MPKRIGYLYDQVITTENCAAAVREMTKHKRHNHRACIMRDHAAYYGDCAAGELRNGAWVPKPYTQHIIIDGIRHKERTIKVPCLHDQLIHHAVMRVVVPLILRRNYYYNCGSIPHAGQSRANKALQRWMRRKKPYKYALSLDIRKFYDTCPHWVVMRALRRIIKDERNLALHQQMLGSMSADGIGLAIGYYPSQWYANLALSEVNRAIKQRILPDCKLVRYMDDMVLLHNNKRKLHRAHKAIEQLLGTMGLQLKGNWQVYRIKGRGIKYLSYRYFHDCTVMSKPLMYRMTRRIRAAARCMTLHRATSIMSYIGILRQCNSYNYRKKWIYGTISIKNAKEMIGYAAKIGIRRASATSHDHGLRRHVDANVCGQCDGGRPAATG